MAKLKVYCTPIGFHNAYVAAPSQKAALAAWGSTADLFARGVAEAVDDPALTAAPLAHPGEVVKVLRGTAAEQLAAAPASKRGGNSSTAKPKRPSKARPPRPDHTAVELAERAVAEARERQRGEERVLAEAEAELAERRRATRARQAAELADLEAARDRAELAYADALRAWQAG